MLILVANDDGYLAPGIKAMVNIAKEFGQVLVAAPEKGYSGWSHAVSLETPLNFYYTDYFGKDVKAIICNGTPVDCVKLALNEVLDRKPDLILSGINHGANHSINAFYSGTVAVAIEGAFHSIPALASSITSFNKNTDLSEAINWTKKVIKYVINHPQKHNFCFNLNIPEGKVKGLKVVRMSRGAWFEEYIKWYHPVRKQNFYWLTGKFYNFEADSTDTDVYFLEQGYATLVPIKIDLTDYNVLNQIKDLESIN